MKILISYHKNSTRLRTSILTPVHAGRALASEQTKRELCDLLGDDTGDNISHKNGSFCEMTVIYWAWKNYEKLGNPSNIGFMHYRRHLSFTGKGKQDTGGMINYACLDEKYIRTEGLEDKVIKDMVSVYPVITTETWDVRNAELENNREAYAAGEHLNIKDYDCTIKILKDIYPEYSQFADIYNAIPLGFYTNIFIMRKEIFFDYCEWIFNILFKAEKCIDTSIYKTEEKRVFGHIAERLTGIYLFKNKYKYRIKELKCTFIYNTNYVPLTAGIDICFAADDNYAAQLATAITSILVNSNEGDQHNFYILNNGLSKTNRASLEKLKKIKQFYIQYIPVNDDDFSVCPWPTSVDRAVPAYYRMKIPSYFGSISKVLYLDCDVIVRGSLRDLWETDISGYYIAAAIDIYGAASAERLKLTSVCINAGVMLVNLDLWREDGVESKLFDYVEKNSDMLIWAAKDAINAVVKDRVLVLDDKWNYQHSTNYGLQVEHKDYFERPLDNSVIVHFIGYSKPWLPGIKVGNKDLWWNCLKLTPWKRKLHKAQRLGLLQKLFSVRDEGMRMIIHLLGIKITIRK